MAKGCTKNTYEEARKQRLEENKKRFEDLGISKISKNLTEISTPVKKTQPRLSKLKSMANDLVEPRRSSRVRNPVPLYQEESGVDIPALRKRSRSNSSSCYSYIARPLHEIKKATDKQRTRAWEAAEKLQTNLQSKNPSFIKSMVRSHVYSCFWLGLPSKFCDQHLPDTLHDMILEDEHGSDYDVVYIGKRSGLSGGWRAFALDHKLDDGDALVFELIERARFKIYIVKAFPDSIEQDEKEVSEEEGNMRVTKALKAGTNDESKSKKTKKSNQATAHEANKSGSSEEYTQESSIDNEAKPQEVSPTEKSVSQKRMQKKSKMAATTGESKEKAQVERLKANNLVKPRATTGESKENAQVERPKANNLVKPRAVNSGMRVSQKHKKKEAAKLFRRRA